MARNYSLNPISKYSESINESSLIFWMEYILPYDDFVNEKMFFLFDNYVFNTNEYRWLFGFNISYGDLYVTFTYKDQENELDLSTCFLDLSPFELVDEIQWSGRNPAQRMKWNSNTNEWIPTNDPEDRERACWEISTFDNATSRRIIVGRSHGSKDGMVRIVNQLNTILQLARELAAPYEQDIREIFAVFSNDESSEDDIEEAKKRRLDLLPELQKAWSEFNCPKWMNDTEFS